MFRKAAIISVIFTLISCTPIGPFDEHFQGAIIGGGEALRQLGEDVVQYRDANQKFVPSFKSNGRERAAIERESKLSQLDSAYSYTQNFVGGLYNARPLVDTIQEHEKYGNNAEGPRRISTAIINGFDGISNVANALIDAPYDKARHLSRTATAALNSIGAKLVGL
ncbi:PREDICTED: uncharacterized protein LOC108562175 isoform X2 [Nicrophorus vespilloides]|nr:PREDICTED: uncharacterized protein LOC108562175 isoform X2 [Nicrophorus vespilloides]XP_017775920.1 PREDICTED: uncharacterized protein LOC108562175 isoform X2 [Nicrophorus vespilloides]XP_017775921.1 PREDICTED: uncharacterized protein LOC108562175 isoform X2 [Nicrophorus vespilloides]